MTIKITLIPGDGIGPEISEAACKVLEAAKVPIDWETHIAGQTAFDKIGNPLPEKTLESIQKNKIALKGPLKTPTIEGFKSINLAFRKHFDLYVNLRPTKSFEGVPTRYNNIDLVVVRENTEELYSGIERYTSPNKESAETVSVVTKKGSERIIRWAFDYAIRNKRKKVTLVHKANILKATSGLFLEAGRRIAPEYPNIEFDEKIIDNMCMQLVINPHQFDVIVSTNLFGDILSDLTSGLVGGLGLAPSANMGHKVAIFESVHGIAPDIAGRGIANPSALLLSACLMLNYLQMEKAAQKIKTALLKTFKEGKVLTPDLKGNASTLQFTDAVIKNL
ncbi:MAG: NAD-dependent isocitrate dehydrogenase [Deltaproteobacteria bacterium]|nr:NAD-dependent isocitrate dehydrogenase [Deltaproteobacteria bacterium]